MRAQFQQSYLSIQPVSVYYIIQSYQHLFKLNLKKKKLQKSDKVMRYLFFTYGHTQTSQLVQSTAAVWSVCRLVLHNAIVAALLTSVIFFYK